ncbi:N-acetylmuramoyl-L-alanine amidase [Paraburkholderia aspalathi]|nr:N-acetylmuramoyl-L-alanine amidase [Paraburkholderia aspalathi]
MRRIHTAVVHCTATPEGKDFSVATIRGWHKQLGWSDIGYHFIIQIDGRISPGRPIEKVGAHVAGHNAGSVGISYVGGVDTKGKSKDTRTPAQKSALRTLLADLVKKYGITKICGHHDLFAGKDCPCFDAIPEYADLLGR